MAPPLRPPLGASPMAVLIQERLQEAVRLHQAGQLDAAEAHYRFILKRAPDHAEALHLLGNVVYQRGEADKAVELIGKAIKANPKNASYPYNRALILEEQNRPEAALAGYDKAIALEPGFLDAHVRRGAALKTLGRLDAAVAAYDRVLALDPAHADAHLDRGNALRALGRLDEALASYDRATALKPASPHGHYNRGIALQDQGRLEAAVQAYDLALARKPDFLRAHANRANALRDLGQLHAALAGHERALALDPAMAQSHYNRGLVLQDLRRLAEATAAYDRAIALKPDHAEAHLAKAGALLVGGDLAAGWPLYEWRWRIGGAEARPAFMRPQWTGAEPLAGKTILLWSEQGLGDTLQFCRFAAPVAARGARVVLRVQAALVPLLRDLDGVGQVIATGDPPPAFDYHAPLLSLPLALGATLQTLPAPAAYLRADPARIARWADRLGPRTGPRVGLVWSGNPRHRNDRNRSIPLARMLASLPRGLDYVSLQDGVRDTDMTALAAGARHFGPDLTDFAETAALASLMDAVLTVDTSVAHLAGALGLPTLVLLPAVAQDWRWLLERRDSPWYRSLALHRQGLDCDWAAPLDQAARDLARLTAG